MILCAIKDRTTLAQKMSVPLYANVTRTYDCLYSLTSNLYDT